MLGYDDERGDYKMLLNDHLEYRYEVLAIFGKGSFGQVTREAHARLRSPLVEPVLLCVLGSQGSRSQERR